ATGILAALWLEESLKKIIPQYYKGARSSKSHLHVQYDCKHERDDSLTISVSLNINDETPCAIPKAAQVENWHVHLLVVPDLIQMLSWHANKYIDTEESGVVPSILHVNGFKLSERNIFGAYIVSSRGLVQWIWVQSTISGGHGQHQYGLAPFYNMDCERSPQNSDSDASRIPNFEVVLTDANFENGRDRLILRL
ncbi:D-xylulose 5-phosphate/D-fructose 6-phosphate phosphoketolase, partial [Penicillium malachiteum]